MTTQGHHEATAPYQLGIDVGSTTVKAASWTETADFSPTTGATMPTCAHP